MKVIAIIPARFAATRFPGKLMENLGGKTVISTTYQNAVQSQLFEEVFVATDSEVIFNEITKNGGRAVMTGSHETGSDRIAEAASQVEAEVIVNIQGDEPFLNREPLRQLIRVFQEDAAKSTDAASLKIKIKDPVEIDSPHAVKVITDLAGNALYFSRSRIPFARDAAAAEYFRHIGVYAFRREALLKFAALPQSPLEKAEKIEALRFLENGMRIRMVQTDFVGVGIDVPEDLEKAKKLLNDYHFTNKEEMP